MNDADFALSVLRETRTFPITVSLSPGAIAEAVECGVGRMDRSGHLPDAHGLERSGDPTERHIEGCKAELAFATATGQPWTPVVDDYREIAGNDVGEYGVRGTAHRRGGLILHPEDEDERIFVLVVSADEPDFVIAGWMRGEDGKRPEFWEEKKLYSPAFLVPQGRLEITPPEGMFL